MVLLTTSTDEDQMNIIDSNEIKWNPSAKKEYRSYLILLLMKCKHVNDGEQKKAISLKIFRSLARNKWLIDDDLRFKTIMLDKLHELSITDNWDMARFFLRHFQTATTINTRD